VIEAFTTPFEILGNRRNLPAAKAQARCRNSQRQCAGTADKIVELWLVHITLTRKSHGPFCWLTLYCAVCATPSSSGKPTRLIFHHRTQSVIQANDPSMETTGGSFVCVTRGTTTLCSSARVLDHPALQLRPSCPPSPTRKQCRGLFASCEMTVTARSVLFSVGVSQPAHT
jgi:hypothetical protein